MKRQRETQRVRPRETTSNRKEQKEEPKRDPCQNNSPYIKRIDIINVEQPSAQYFDKNFTLAIIGECLCGDVYIQGNRENVKIVSSTRDRIVIVWKKSMNALWHIQLKGDYCGTSNVYSKEF
jgi:hypothetical protein